AVTGHGVVSVVAEGPPGQNKRDLSSDYIVGRSKRSGLPRRGQASQLQEREEMWRLHLCCIRSSHYSTSSARSRGSPICPATTPSSSPRQPARSRTTPAARH